MKNTVMSGKLLLGTCSWNYDSWVGLLYTSAQPTAAAYLPEYSRSLPTAEVDSWFYRLPSPADVRAYLSAVPESFRFTCKVLQDVTLTHHRSLKGGKKPLRPNENFLSVSRFESFLGAIEPLLPRLDAIMFEFEYLNKQKMPSLEAFLERLDGFFAKLPPGLPYALEPRNGNYLKDEYFAFLNSRRLIHVYSEKIYMPHVYDVYEKHPDLSAPTVVLRLLGGDRKEIEKATDERWDRAVSPKDDKDRIVRMSVDLVRRGKTVVINVNNHYEGSAPVTIEVLKRLFGSHGLRV